MYRASEWTLGFLDKVYALRDSKLYDPAKYYSTWEQGELAGLPLRGSVMPSWQGCRREVLWDKRRLAGKTASRVRDVYGEHVPQWT